MGACLQRQTGVLPGYGEGKIAHSSTPQYTTLFADPQLAHKNPTLSRYADDEQAPFTLHRSRSTTLGQALSSRRINAGTQQSVNAASMQAKSTPQQSPNAEAYTPAAEPEVSTLHVPQPTKRRHAYDFNTYSPDDVLQVVHPHEVADVVRQHTNTQRPSHQQQRSASVPSFHRQHPSISISNCSSVVPTHQRNGSTSINRTDDNDTLTARFNNLLRDSDNQQHSRTNSYDPDLNGLSLFYGCKRSVSEQVPDSKYYSSQPSRNPYSLQLEDVTEAGSPVTSYDALNEGRTCMSILRSLNTSAQSSPALSQLTDRHRNHPSTSDCDLQSDASPHISSRYQSSPASHITKRFADDDFQSRATTVVHSQASTPSASNTYKFLTPPSTARQQSQLSRPNSGSLRKTLSNYQSPVRNTGMGPSTVKSARQIYPSLQQRSTRFNSDGSGWSDEYDEDSEYEFDAR